MTNISFITGVITFLLFVFPSTAEIKTFTMTSNTRSLILFEIFGFTQTGHVAITASSVSVVTSQQPNQSRLGFFLLNEASIAKVKTEIQHNPTFCLLDSLHITRLFTFHDLLPHPATTFNHTYLVTSPGEYSIFFTNCATGSSVSMTIHTEFFNLNNDSSRNYLSSDQTHLPYLFFTFFITYLFFLTFFLRLCHVSNHSFHSIHLLMTTLLLAQAVTLLCEAGQKQSVNITGTGNGWDMFFFVSRFVHVVLLFTVVVLVGTRWTFLHPFVLERGKKVLLILIPLQALAHVAYVVVHNTGPYIEDWVFWNQVFLLLDFFSCFVVLLLVVWAVRSFRGSKKDSVNLNKFRLMWWFYMIAIAYLFLTRFGLFALRAALIYEYRWLGNLVEETLTLVFCIVMFNVFRIFDKEKNEYSVVGEEVEKVPNITLKG